jgi:hypothetical protein
MQDDAAVRGGASPPKAAAAAAAAAGGGDALALGRLALADPPACGGCLSPCSDVPGPRGMAADSVHSSSIASSSRSSSGELICGGGGGGLPACCGGCCGGSQEGGPAVGAGAADPAWAAFSRQQHAAAPATWSATSAAGTPV